ncbi:hypothetical protein COL26b_011712 [Colletotrichum chrysophilum]|uniref:uncharacterized protein n=1 Tax=Colletotrichum chrysophilum TaxID=1836956 RepID=UPI002301B76F|nr:uncharacterized protein COL26b_011712 [Colletotrichum chrysophilum]KAJ0366215.1 hypothetical protein COL26b_011712 [Colletotrichum chrysophilum]
MRFLSTFILVGLTASVSAIPVALPPGFFHPPVHAFKDETSVESMDAEPIEARSGITVDKVDVASTLNARSEDAMNFMDSEPIINARNEESVDDFIDTKPRIQARSESNMDLTDSEPQIEARSGESVDFVNPAPEPYIQPRSEEVVDFSWTSEPVFDAVGLETKIKARSETMVEAVDSAEGVAQGNEEPRIQARGDTSADWVDPDYRPPLGPADEWKYQDNLRKLHANDCGVDCHRSINSYQSRVSRANRANKGIYDGHDFQYDYRNKKDVPKYPKYDLTTVQRNVAGHSPNTYDHHPTTYDHHDYNGYTRSSRASRGEHNTPADDWKYRDNLVKQQTHDCGVNCHRSINSYQSVASKDSRLSREARERNGYYDHHNNGGYHPNTYDHHSVGNGYHPTTYDHHTGPVTYDRHNGGNNHGLSRAERGVHNTKQDYINHELNHIKEDKHQCGINCQRSDASFHSVASADHKRSQQSKLAHGGSYHGH